MNFAMIRGVPTSIETKIGGHQSTKLKILLFVRPTARILDNSQPTHIGNDDIDGNGMETSA